jgi:hypothetical protein
LKAGTHLQRIEGVMDMKTSIEAKFRRSVDDLQKDSIGTGESEEDLTKMNDNCEDPHQEKLRQIRNFG